MYHIGNRGDKRCAEEISSDWIDGLECLKQTNHQCGLYRYLPSLDNGGTGGPVSCPPKKCQDSPTVGILMVMRLSAATLVSVLPLLFSLPRFSYEDKNKAKGRSIFDSEFGKERYKPCVRVSYSRGIPRPRLCMFGTLSGTMGLKWFSAPHREKLWRDRWLTLLRSRPSSFISSPPFLAWQHQNHHH